MPTLLFSGTLDPVTSPRFGEEAARHLSNSLHVVVPASHGIGGPCVDSIARQFLDSGSVERIDISCVKEIRLPAFEVARASDAP